MNRIIFIVVLLVFCAGIGLSNAELYEWVDKDRVKHFSNDESDIPPAIPVETEDEITYDPAEDAEREKQDQKTMEAVSRKEAERDSESERADKQTAQPSAPTTTTNIEEDDYYHDHDARREKELHDTERLNEPGQEMHPEVHHEHRIHHRETR